MKLTLLLFVLVAPEPVKAESDFTVLCMGDSITKGVREGVGPEETFASLVESDLRARWPAIRVINDGVGGENTEQARQRIDRQIAASSPKVVVLMYGTNDAHIDAGKRESRVALPQYVANLEHMIGTIRRAGAEPLLMTMPCYAKDSPPNGLGEHANKRLAPYASAVREIAQRLDAALVDHFEHWSKELEGGTNLSEWTTDGYHPNPRGHQRIAELMKAPLIDVIEDAHAGPLDYTVRVETILEHDDGKSLWYHPRAAVYPNPFTRAVVPTYLMTLQKHLMVSDHYAGLAMMLRWRSQWPPPAEVPSLAWQQDESGATIGVCDVTPGFHEPSGKVIAIGVKVLYDAKGGQITNKPQSQEVAYAIFTPTPEGGEWSEWRFLTLPNEEKFFLAIAGCCQWLVEPDGSLLIPIYHKGPGGEAYSVTVIRCAFDGKDMQFIRQGNTLELAEVRGLCEPSLAKFRGAYYLTLRNDLKGYVTTSKDGLAYDPIKPWTFDDGSDLGSYNTQQHWLVHSSGLFLIYTRRGAQNDHMFRHRAPLLMARIDPEALHAVRVSEKIVIPERGGEMGNFGASAISPWESWVTVGEGVWDDASRKRGAKGALLIAHVEWSSPNRLRGGSGPGAWVDRVRWTK